MSELRGVVVAHGEVAVALVRVVEGITGITGALTGISNDGCAPPQLEAKIREAIGPEGAMVFADLEGGSCAFAGRCAGRERSLVVITGVNLPMLIDFVFHRGMEVEALAQRLVEKARLGVQIAYAQENPCADSPLSR